jgi:hypothetical protein
MLPAKTARNRASLLPFPHCQHLLPDTSCGPLCVQSFAPHMHVPVLFPTDYQLLTAKPTLQVHTPLYSPSPHCPLTLGVLATLM